MTADPFAIPREVWRRFVESGGLERVEPMSYHQPLTTIRLDPATAQEEADTQRQRFRRLIFELFPLDRVEAFIAAQLGAGLYPDLRAFHFDVGLMQPLASMLAHEIKAVGAPFDLEAERARQYGKPQFDTAEIRYAVELMQFRPALALALMYLRGFLETWAHALGQAASGYSLSAEHTRSFFFFFTHWNQNSFVTALYPAIALHLRPKIEPGAKRIDEPAFTRELMSDVVTWLTAKGFFTRQTAVEWHGYEAKLSCAATGMVNQALGQRGWLNMIFDQVVKDQRLPLMSHYLEQVVVCGKRLAALPPPRQADAAYRT